MTDLELKLQVRQALDASLPPLPDDPRLADKVLDLHEEKRQILRQRMLWLRVAVAAAVIVLIVCSGLLIGDWSFIHLERWQSDDHGLYFIDAELVTPAIQGSANAANAYPGDIYIKTTDWNEIVTALDPAPMAPSWLPDGWSVYQYLVDYMENLSSFNATYQKPMPTDDDPEHIGYIVYCSLTFWNDEAPYVQLEQNDTGILVQLENGLSIYLTTNYEYTVALWVDGQTSYTISAPIPEDDVLHIIRSTYGLD